MIDLGSETWGNVLRAGLGAQYVHLSDGGIVACFKAGPFRVAYPDFLTGSQGDLGSDAMEARLDAARSMRADLMRIQTGKMHGVVKSLAIHRLGTVVIPELNDWDPKRYEKPRRTSNRLGKTSLILRSAREADGAVMHQMYLSTLRRHGGSARYNRRYFELIAPYAATIAELDGIVCGFVCVGFHGLRAFYMHGAHAENTRKHYVSDLLFLHMLTEARRAGKTRFDFLPSPKGQPSLTAYKMAWGGKEEGLVVADVALNPLRARGFSIAVKLVNALQATRHA